MINKTSVNKFIFESIAIIASILIAFSIDSYWEIYKENQTRKSVILALEKDFEKTYQGLESSISHKNSIVETMVKLILLSDVGIQELEAKETQRMISSLTTVYTYLPPTGSVESLVSSGQLNKINNQKLREALASYRINLQSLNRTQKWVLEVTNLRTIPYLAERIPMHLFSFNGPEVEDNVQNLNTELNINAVKTYIVPLFKEIAFRNLAQNRVLSARLIIFKLKILLESVTEVCEALENKKCSVTRT